MRVLFKSPKERERNRFCRITSSVILLITLKKKTYAKGFFREEERKFKYYVLFFVSFFFLCVFYTSLEFYFPNVRFIYLPIQ